MKPPRKLSTKIKSPVSLQRVFKKRPRTTVVFTNGCFDLLHKGHVTYLQNARALGGLLVVALNSDASVRKIKGPERPLNTLADRMEVIAALESVDYVTWFEEETPEALINLLKPKVLVKGGDWRPDQIVGSDLVLSLGGKVLSLPYVAGQSTTQIIKRARR